MEAHALGSMKEKDLNARVERVSRERTAKKSTFVFQILAKMGQHAQKELEGDMNALVLLDTKASHVKKGAFVIQILV